VTSINYVIADLLLYYLQSQNTNLESEISPKPK